MALAACTWSTRADGTQTLHSMKRQTFVAGVSAGFMLVPGLPGVACEFNANNTAFHDYFVQWDRFKVPFRGRVPQVYSSGEGPAVIILHEIGGASPAVFAFAHRVASRNFKVIVPVLFGTPNHPASPVYTAEQAARICIGHEFSCLSSHSSSPVIDWVRGLAAEVYKEALLARNSTPGIGVVGLCLTGNFALAMAADEHLIAPVVSEPALPFAVSWLPENRSSLGLSSTEIEALKTRLRRGMDVAAFRFADDPIVPPERMKTLRSIVEGEGAQLIGNVNINRTCPRAHAVFTDHFNPRSPDSLEAFETLISFLKERLTNS